MDPIATKVVRLLNELTEEDKKKDPRIYSFINLWQFSHGGMFDITEHTEFFQYVHEYALAQINKYYKEKYGEPLI